MLNRLFHHNGGITKFMVGEGFPLPPFVFVKSFVHGSPRTSTPTDMAVTVYSTIAVILPHLIVGTGVQIFAKQILHRLRYADMVHFILFIVHSTITV